MNVFFDVLGTLLSEEEIPHPRAREAFLTLKEQGHDLYLWSSGGAGYGGYRIKPFDDDPWDEELLRAAEAVGR
jgi:hypothetical protein